MARGPMLEVPFEIDGSRSRCASEQDYELLVQSLESENRYLREQTGSTVSWEGKVESLSSLSDLQQAHLKACRSASITTKWQEAAIENEEVLEKNRELNELVGQIRRLQRVQETQIEAQEIATQEMAMSLRHLESPCDDLQQENEKLVACAGLAMPPMGPPRLASYPMSVQESMRSQKSEASRQDADREVDARNSQAVIDLRHEVHILRTEHQEALQESHRQKDKRQELNLMNEELHLLLETERHAYSSKCSEVERLRAKMYRDRSKRLMMCSTLSRVASNEANIMGPGESTGGSSDLMSQIWQASSFDDMEGSSDEEDLDDGPDKNESPLQGILPNVVQGPPRPQELLRTLSAPSSTAAASLNLPKRPMFSNRAASNPEVSGRYSRDTVTSRYSSTTMTTMACIQEEPEEPQSPPPEAGDSSLQGLREWLDIPNKMSSVRSGPAGPESGAMRSLSLSSSNGRTSPDHSSGLSRLPEQYPARASETETFLDSVMRTFVCCGRGVVLLEGAGNLVQMHSSNR